MRLEYDPRGDIAYVQVAPDADAKVDHTERVGESEEYERGIDFDADGGIVGYEFMNASHGLNLDGLPHRDEIVEFIATVTTLRTFRRSKRHELQGPLREVYRRLVGIHASAAEATNCDPQIRGWVVRELMGVLRYIQAVSQAERDRVRPTAEPVTE